MMIDKERAAHDDSTRARLLDYSRSKTLRANYMVSRGAYAVGKATQRTWRDCSQEPSRLTRSKRRSYST